MEYVKVIKPGLLTTVQDLGRKPFRKYGVSASGAMDTFSLRMANLLVGNEENAAALEVTLMGPRLQFTSTQLIAITGGNLSPTLNGEPVSMWKAVLVHEGDVLDFGACIEGCRAYIAFAGGIQVPQVMGSRATFLRGEYGGLEGRALKANDQLPIGKPEYKLAPLAGRRLRPSDIPNYKEDRPVRFIFGPQDDAFLPESLESFTSTVYTISNNSDRMGYRLESDTPLKHIDGADIHSDFITVGSIQVPANGLPIVLMADCQMSGGYTKIGAVIQVDLPYMAQKKPGDKITFRAVTIEEAHREYAEQEKKIANVKMHNRLLNIN